MMQPTPPHDHTTLPVSPRFHSHSQTPRPAASIQRVHFTGDPHYDSDPRGGQSFGPRDGRPAVRQWPKTGLLYSLSSAAYTSSPSSPHSPRIAPLSPLHQDLNMNAFAQSTDYHLLTLDQPRPRQRSMIPAYSARKEQLFARKKAPTAMDVKASSKILSALPAKQSSELQMAAKSKAKDIMSKIRAKRIPVDLFDKNFGFSISSRRRSRIESPQVSPRTSISLDEPLRRERIDSTDSAFTDFSFGNNTASSTSSYGGLEPYSPTLKPSRTTSFSAETGEAHPGQPVEFPCSDDANEAEEEEHSYIGFRTVLSVGADLNRLASFPPSSPSDIDMIDPLDMSPNTNSLAGRKRAHSTSPTSPTTSTANKRPAPPLHARSLPFTAAAAAAVAPHMQRTRSDGSAEVFLAHVRASFEARREKEARCEKYDVFRDEETNGFLDSRPL